MDASHKTDPEIMAFAQKANRYLKALAAAPRARICEVVPALATLEALIPKSPESFIIGDAMAGSGYLARYLASLPHTVVAFEACAEMIDRHDGSGFRYIQIEEAADLPSAFAASRIGIAVSLASFHHLIVVDASGVVNRERSLKRQVELVSDCFRIDRHLQHFLIIDVPTEEIHRDNGCWPWYSATDAVWRKSTPIYPFEEKMNTDSNSLDSYQDLLRFEIKCRAPRPDVWFRGVVHHHGIVGHRDSFLTARFIEDLAREGYRVQARTLFTPWIFSDQGSLEHFIWDKFAFREDDHHFKLNHALEAARKLLGIVEFESGATALGWRLAYVLASRT